MECFNFYKKTFTRFFTHDIFALAKKMLFWQNGDWWWLTLNTVLVAGYAKAPQGTPMHEVYRHTGVILEINVETNIIENVSFTFISDLTNDFCKRLIHLYDLSNGNEEIIEKIKLHYLVPSQQALIVALKSAIQRYWQLKNITTV